MAVVVNLSIDQGADFSFVINLANDDGTPLPLYGYSGAGLLREEYNSASGTPLTITITDPANGGITLSMANADTSTLLAPYRYVYDVKMTAPASGISGYSGLSNQQTRVIEGIATVDPQATY